MSASFVLIDLHSVPPARAICKKQSSLGRREFFRHLIPPLARTWNRTLQTARNYRDFCCGDNVIDAIPCMINECEPKATCCVFVGHVRSI